MIKNTVREVRAEIFKPRPLISEKLAFGCTLIFKTKQISQCETTIGMILQVKIKEKEYVTHKMASTGTYPSTYILHAVLWARLSHRQERVWSNSHLVLAFVLHTQQQSTL